MNTHEPGSLEWELDLCRREYKQAWDECDNAARHYNEWKERLESARQSLYRAAKILNERYQQDSPDRLGHN